MKRSLALSLVALAGLTLAWSGMVREPGRWGEPDASKASRGSLRVDAPTSSAAGEAVVVQISGASPTVDEAAVVVTTTAGAASLAAPLAQGKAVVTLPDAVSSSAGVITIWVIAGADEAIADVEVVAGPPVAPIVPLVGAKSIVADGVDRAMVVGLPADRFGNPVENRGDVVVTLWRSSGGSEALGAIRTGLVVWQWLRAGTVAGRDQVALRLGFADGPVADLLEVPGAPRSVTLEVDDVPLVADGQTLHVVTTDQLVDSNGNVLLDGSAVRLLVEAPTGRQQATGSTIGGRATFRIEAPAAPGPVRMVATVAGVTSDPVVLDFGPAVSGWPVRIVRSGRAWVVDVGPVERIGGGWAPDGTEVVLTDGSVRESAQLEGGRARFEVRTRPSVTAAIGILGVVEGVEP